MRKLVYKCDYPDCAGVFDDTMDGTVFRFRRRPEQSESVAVCSSQLRAFEKVDVFYSKGSGVAAIYSVADGRYYSVQEVEEKTEMLPVLRKLIEHHNL